MVVFCSVPVLVFAQDKGLSSQACYAAFSKYTPEKVIQMAEKVQDHVIKNGKKGFSDLNRPSPMVWPEVPLSPVVSVVNCGEMKLETFAIPEMYEAVTTKGFLRKFVDADGQPTFVKLCAKIRSENGRAWVMQNHYWAGCDGPLKMGVLLVKVPNSPYSVQVSLPSDKISLSLLNRALK